MVRERSQNREKLQEGAERRSGATGRNREIKIIVAKQA